MDRQVTRQVLGQVAEVAATEMPLAEGLRAAAREAGNSRTATALTRIADRMETGESLQHVLEQPARHLPPHVRALLQGASSDSDVCLVLVELSQHEREVRAVRWETISALIYPAILVCFTLLVVGFVIQAVVPGLRSMYDMLRGFAVPSIGTSGTITVLWFHAHGLRLCAGFLIVIAVVAGLLRLVLGAGNWRWLLGTAPVVGPLLVSAGAWEFARLMRMLLQRKMALPQALRLTAAGIHDANLAAAARRLARQIDAGAALGASMLNSTRIPVTLSALSDWGERHDALGESFEVAADVFEGRLRLRTAWLNIVLPPVVYIGVAAIAVGLVVSLLSPLFTMIQALS